MRGGRLGYWGTGISIDEKHNEVRREAALRRRRSHVAIGVILRGVGACRIDGRLLFVPNQVVVSYSMLMSRNASATSTMAMPA